MRKLRHAVTLLSLALASLALFSVVSLRRDAALAGPGWRDAAGNGDVDCSGRLDINDPVYLLNFMFQGGPAPCAIAQEPDDCCPELVAAIERLTDAIEQPCISRVDRFVPVEDGIAFDSCMGLMWQTRFVRMDIDADGVREREFNWARAAVVAADSRVGGFDDWRVPSAHEMESLIAYLAAKPFQFSSLPPFEVNLGDQSRWYWSATDSAFGVLTAHLRPGLSILRAQPPSNECTVLLVRGPVE